MTIERLAEVAELSTNYVGAVENGKRDPSLSTIFAIAKGLGVVPADLLGGVEGMTPEALEMARWFDRATADDQDALLRLARSVGRRRPPKA